LVQPYSSIIQDAVRANELVIEYPRCVVGEIAVWKHEKDHESLLPIGGFSFHESPEITKGDSDALAASPFIATAAARRVNS
jgi:hypothetical protein